MRASRARARRSSQAEASSSPARKRRALIAVTIGPGRSWPMFAASSLGDLVRSRREGRAYGIAARQWAGLEVADWTRTGRLASPGAKQPSDTKG